ncbi:MAG: hypothetical protein H7Y43_11050 [Akkermansiaceae bacterium]|nr:hypothetical protein [Verrucomicrobiales bacterium]
MEIDGQLRKVIFIIKMRGSNHSKDIREYMITDKGVMIIGPRQTDYAKLTTGAPEWISQPQEAEPEPKAAKKREIRGYTEARRSDEPQKHGAARPRPK